MHSLTECFHGTCLADFFILQLIANREIKICRTYRFASVGAPPRRAAIAEDISIDATSFVVSDNVEGLLGSVRADNLYQTQTV